MKTIIVGIFFTMSCLNSFGQDISFYKHVARYEYHSQYDLVDSMAKFEQRFPNYIIKKDLKFDIQIIVMDSKPYTVTDSLKLLIKTRLKRAFEKSFITFEFKKECFQLYSDKTVDYFYDNYEKQIDSCFYNKNVINLYLFNNIGNSYIGLSQYPFTKYNRLMVNIENIKDGTLEHEFGHYFGLLHTFDRSYFIQEFSPNLEGDAIEDTTPDKEGIAYSETFCSCFGDYKDVLGNIYKPDMSNYMSYYGICRNKFTDKQIKRMNLMAQYRKEKPFKN